MLKVSTRGGDCPPPCPLDKAHRHEVSSIDHPMNFADANPKRPHGALDADAAAPGIILLSRLNG